jgi:hypothetical protein
VIVTTINGTKFLINIEENTWARIDATGDSGNLRSEEGTFDKIYGPTIGMPMTLICPPFVPGAISRLIQTSPIERIDYV